MGAARLIKAGATRIVQHLVPWLFWWKEHFRRTFSSRNQMLHPPSVQTHMVGAGFALISACTKEGYLARMCLHLIKAGATKIVQHLVPWLFWWKEGPETHHAKHGKRDACLLMHSGAHTP